MIGFLVRAAIGGAVAYGVLRILEESNAVEKATALGSHLLDIAAEKLVPFMDSPNGKEAS